LLQRRCPDHLGDSIQFIPTSYTVGNREEEMPFKANVVLAGWQYEQLYRAQN
jgi:hypothetical protein